jgi:serine/threonine protein kinase
MAPEIAMSQEYSKSIDMWSLGIIMYNLLSGGGHPLHRKGDTSEIFKAKLQNKENFYFDPSFSDLAKDLIKKMTDYSPFYRYSIDQALKHPWITRNNDDKIPLTYLEMIEHADCHDKLKLVKFYFSDNMI